MDEHDITPPAAVPPLGPGADDPQSPAGQAALVTGPLGPGDDDPRSPARVLPRPVVVPVSNPDDDFDFLAPPAAGPGDPAGGARHVVRIPKAPGSAPLARADSLNEREQE